MSARERTWLLGLLALAHASAVIVLVVVRHRLLVAWPMIAALLVPWLGLSILLRLREDTLGREGKYVDWWSVPHFLTGVLFGLFGIGVFWLATIATTWELTEIVARTEEHATNRVIDIVLAIAGWAVANALAGGVFAVW